MSNVPVFMRMYSLTRRAATFTNADAREMNRASSSGPDQQEEPSRINGSYNLLVAKPHNAVGESLCPAQCQSHIANAMSEASKNTSVIATSNPGILCKSILCLLFIPFTKGFHVTVGAVVPPSWASSIRTVLPFPPLLGRDRDRRALGSLRGSLAAP